MLVLLALAVVTDPALAGLRTAEARLAAVAYRLQAANTELCPRTENLPGFSLDAASRYTPDNRARVAAQLGFDTRPSVAAVFPDSPAARAGLMPGDHIDAIDDEVAPAPAKAEPGYDQVSATYDLLGRALLARPVVLSVRHADDTRSRVAVRGMRGCASRVELVPAGKLNAHSDGRRMQISGKMFDFAATDDALAAVTAHELAHNILGHAGSRIAGKTAEYEADWLSVWLVARAGFDVTAVVPFWTRLGKKFDYGIFADGTHPGWRRRIARLAEAVRAVTAQRAAGRPLLPPAQ